MKVAVAQISCSLGDPEANLLKVRDFTRRAKDEAGAELIVFPEMIDTGYSMRVIREHANEWNRGFLPRLQEVARKLSVAIVAGVSERNGSLRATPSRALSSAVCISASASAMTFAFPRCTENW